MRQARITGATVAAVLFLSGCVTTHYLPTNGAVYPPRSPDCDIEVYASGVPAAEYVEIGIVEGEGNHWKSDLEDILPELQAEACLAGGHAIILGDTDAYSEGRDGTPVMHTSAVVIRWVR